MLRRAIAGTTTSQHTSFDLGLFESARGILRHSVRLFESARGMCERRACRLPWRLPTQHAPSPLSVRAFYPLPSRRAPFGAHDVHALGIVAHHAQRQRGECASDVLADFRASPNPCPLPMRAFYSLPSSRRAPFGALVMNMFMLSRDRPSCTAPQRGKHTAETSTPYRGRASSHWRAVDMSTASFSSSPSSSP